MRNHRLFDVEKVDQILPCRHIESQDGLMLGDILPGLGSDAAWLSNLYSMY